MNKGIKIFLLAAGLGMRLRPVTDFYPKPLVPVLGKPLLERIFDSLSKIPNAGTGLNVHYKAKEIENWISVHDKKVEIFYEDPVLGTGGALKNAESFLQGNTFLVHNADIISEIDLGGLLEFHLSTGNMATLAVHDFPQFNNVEINNEGLVRNVSKENSTGGRKVAFTGIAVYSPDFLGFLPAGISSVVDAWLRAGKAGFKIGIWDVTGSFWSDIGTPQSYASTVFRMLKSGGETVFIDSPDRGCSEAGLDGFIVIEKEAAVSSGSFLRNCIALPGTALEGVYENCIAGPDFTLHFQENELFETSDWQGDHRYHIGTGGSDRQYYRIKKENGTAVLMQCGPNDPDFNRHLEYSNFFGRFKIPVPALISIMPDSMSAVFEDLGDMSLYSWLKCPRDKDQIVEIYKRIIDNLILLHNDATEHIDECPLLRGRIFDYEHFRWETGYFLERFVIGLKGINPGEFPGLDSEFDRLARTADSFPKTIVHRDFQSQNIMIRAGIPRIIDFQGARMGPPGFDLVSLLWDPYYRLDAESRENLVGYYIRRSGEKNRQFSEKEFRDTLLVCRLQRHMQALGAYGFLSQVKGKKYFLKHIPVAMAYLTEEISLSGDEYPELHRLAAILVRDNGITICCNGSAVPERHESPSFLLPRIRGGRAKKG